YCTASHACDGRKVPEPITRLLVSSLSSAMRTSKLSPTSRSSHDSHHAIAGSRCACPSVNKGSSTLASAMQRTRLGHFGLLNGFGVKTLHGFGAQLAQRGVGRKLDRRAGQPLGRP